MMAVLVSLLETFRRCVRSRAAVQLEVLALRHQLHVLERSRSRRLGLTHADRLLWVWLSRVWTDWRTMLVIVKPETVIAWHRRGFRMFWAWKSRRRLGRPTVPLDVRTLIRTMSAANPLWGAPRIHGELRKLGIDISQASVAKYMIRHRRPPSQTWANHAGQWQISKLYRGADFYKQNRISWDRVKQGFIDREALYGLSLRNLNTFCQLAGAAADRKTTRALMARIGDAWDADVWKERKYFEGYRKWAGE